MEEWKIGRAEEHGQEALATLLYLSGRAFIGVCWLVC
jgi:hypothetical protein